MLVPRSLHEDVLGDLHIEYTSPRQFMRDTARWLSRAIPGQVRRSFNIALVGGQACALCVSFMGAPFSLGLAAGLAVGLAVLSLRDAHTFPAESPAEAALDAIVAVTFVFVSQIVMAVIASVPAVPLSIMRRGGAASLAALFLLRTIFRRPHGKKPYSSREAAERSYRMVVSLDVMWLIAWFALVITNPDSSIPALNFVFGAVPPVIIAMDYRLRQEGLATPGEKDLPTSIFHNHERSALIRKRYLLWTPKGTGAELLFLAVVVLQFVAGVAGHVAVDWIRAGTNVTAALMLLVVWRYLRKANRTAGRLIQAEIDALGT